MPGVRHHELPPRPNLEYYRKQAKRLHRAHGAGEPQARERVRDVLGDQGRTRFGLTDAQFVLAQEHGFASWADFRARLECSGGDAERAVSRIGQHGEAGYHELAGSLLDQLRAGSPAALRRLRAAVPRFAHAGPAAAREARRRDARLVVAAEFGFPTWRELLDYTARFQRDRAVQLARWRDLAPAVEALRAGRVEQLRALSVDQASSLLHLLTQPDAFADTWLGSELGVPRAGVEVLVGKATNLDDALSRAAAFNRVELVRILLHAGAGTEAHPEVGITPLESAIYHGSAESGDLLAERGVVPRALWTLAGAGHLHAVRECFDAAGRLRPEAVAHRPDPADIGMPARLPPSDDPDEMLAEAFVHACANGRLDVVRWLLDRGVDPDSAPYYGMTGLHYAVAHTRPAAVALLLDRGADVTARDDRHGGDAAGWARHVLGERPDDPDAHEVDRLVRRSETGEEQGP